MDRDRVRTLANTFISERVEEDTRKLGKRSIKSFLQLASFDRVVDLFADITFTIGSSGIDIP